MNYLKVRLVIETKRKKKVITTDDCDKFVDALIKWCEKNGYLMGGSVQVVEEK